jgi:hypothetical protein
LRDSGLLERIMKQPNAVSPFETGVDVGSERIVNADAASLLEIAKELLSHETMVGLAHQDLDGHGDYPRVDGAKK